MGTGNEVKRDKCRKRIKASELAPLKLDRISTSSLKDRVSTVEATDFGSPHQPGGSFRSFLEGLPRILAAGDLCMVAEAVVKACRNGKPVILGMGAHPIKVGLTPVIIDLMERGLLGALALNGACMIHDFELASIGRTSEDVGALIQKGAYGMARETSQFINRAISDGVRCGHGLGRALGESMTKADLRYSHLSLLVRAFQMDIPVTIHVAVGTDIIHMHPEADGASIGEGSLRDFHFFAALVSRLEEGVFINLGSAVIMPEVFIKALSLARNLGFPIRNVTTVNLDFIQHYRPMTNVVSRPTQWGGAGYAITGHHEIIFPLLAAAVIEKIDGGK
ncbi:MAG: hypothetical protein JRG73_13735 [Deltaproteobacteria bacterium]|nr:hypothetical protein [Deltaproteobacteria bacterium]MBW2307982.1 hypothetical protein [Deltaproteobacteria bacterium]